MIFRAATDRDLERVTALMAPDPAGGLTAAAYRIRSRSRQYRPEWTWLAEEREEPGGRNAGGAPASAPAAAAVWWGEPRESRPSALDGVWVRADVAAGARSELAAGLITRAHQSFVRRGATELPRYHIFLPPDWRDRPDAVAALEWREEAARRAGLTERLERLRYEWTADAGVPIGQGRLAFRPEPDDEVFVNVLAEVLDGTLDATTRSEAARVGPRQQARQDVAFYRDQMCGARSWWRIARTPAGRIAGFGIPSCNLEFPVVGYLGVLPGHRGHGYVDEILAEITRILAAQAGATVIHADTDLENRPMAAAFERAGYRDFGRRLVLSAR